MVTYSFLKCKAEKLLSECFLW